MRSNEKKPDRCREKGGNKVKVGRREAQGPQWREGEFRGRGGISEFSLAKTTTKDGTIASRGERERAGAGGGEIHFGSQFKIPK